ncbi:helix-turn-helix domain-containing protein [Rhizobium daejeonense]
MSEFGKLCKRGRAPFEMTRYEMARKLGVSSLLVSRIESGETKPSAGYVCAVTGLLGLSTQEVKAALQADEITADRLVSETIARQ